MFGSNWCWFKFERTIYSLFRGRKSMKTWKHVFILLCTTYLTYPSFLIKVWKLPWILVYQSEFLEFKPQSLNICFHVFVILPYLYLHVPCITGLNLAFVLQLLSFWFLCNSVKLKFLNVFLLWQFVSNWCLVKVTLSYIGIKKYKIMKLYFHVFISKLSYLAFMCLV